MPPIIKQLNDLDNKTDENVKNKINKIWLLMCKYKDLDVLICVRINAVHYVLILSFPSLDTLMILTKKEVIKNKIN